MNNRIFVSALFLSAWQILSFSVARAQDQTVGGNLTVTQGLKAGTSATTGGLELRLDGLFISKGAGGSGNLLAADQGPGTRLLWYPRKAAFRAGQVSGTQWNDSYIGTGSVALGTNVLASGNYSTALGYGSMAGGDYSTALGYGSIAGQDSIAMGRYATASNWYSIAQGYGSLATGFGATAIGLSPEASGYGSISIGFETLAESYLSLAVGYRNVGGGSADVWIPTDPIFEIGIGAPAVYEDGEISIPATRANALTVYKNGKVTIHKRQGDILMGEFGNSGD